MSATRSTSTTSGNNDPIPLGVETETAGLAQTAKTTVSISEENTEEFEIDNTTPAIGLHYDALIPNGVIDEHHVNKILGYKIKTNDERKSTINQWQVWKKDVRGWAGFHIKNMILKEAKQMPTDDEMITPRVNGQLVAKFLDIRRWWASAPADCHKSEATFTYLFLGCGKIFGKRRWRKT